MANNVFQVKRTNVSGRTPNTTGSYVTNSQYIAAGEFALNMADGILYSSNGSAIITVGANLVNKNITGNLTVKAIIANGSIGSAGETLTSNGSAVYWAAGAGSGTVTQVNTGNGMTGGPITTTGTVSILANTGIVANATGTYVNATYIGTLTANNTSFVGSVSAANVVSNAQLSGNLANYVTATNLTNNLANYQTTAGLAANVATLTANNTSFVGTVSAANVVSNAQLSSNLANYQTTAGLSANVATLTANNSNNLNGQPASYYTNATNITTGILPYAQIPANVINTTAAFTISGVHTYNANIVVGTAAGISANGGFGTAGQVLHSNGTSVYWAVDDQGVTSVATGNGLVGGTITTTGTVSILANTGIVANATGTYVNATYIGTLTANNTSFVGTVSAANVVSNAQLSGNLANYAALSGATFTGNVVANNANTTFDLNVGRNLTVAGNLTITGNVTVVGANTLEIVDNFIYLNSNNTTQNEDIGIAGNYNDGTYAHTGIFRDATDGYWKIFDGYTPEPDASVNIDTGNSTFNIAGFWTNNIRLGNSTVYGTINSTSYSGTANNTTYVNSKTEGNLNVNSAAQLTTARNIGDVSFNGTAAIVPQRINYKDTRGTNYNPFTYIGTTLHLKTNTTDGLADGGTYHGVLDLAHWSDASGGVNHQLGLTDNGNVWIRYSTGASTWSSWVQLVSTTSGTANNATNLGGVAAASYVQNTDSRTLSGNLVISGTSFTPSSNTILLGNSTQRWVLSANTGSFSGAVSGITTLAAGNTTLTGWASAQSVIITGGGSYTNGSIYSDSNWGMLFRAKQNSPVAAQFAWKSSDDTTEYMRISPTGNVGIGTSTPSALVHVVDQNNAGWRYEQYNNSDGTNFRNYRARGTIASPLAIISGDRLASFLGAGYNGTTFSGINGGISIRAAENYTNSTTGGTYLVLSTSTIGTNPSGGGVERLRITDSGNVGIGNTSPAYKLRVDGDISLSGGIHANGGFGTAGQVLHSNGTATYWDVDDQGVTSVATGNGLTGGTITSTGTLSVVAGTGAVVNATGVHVNATYIGTLSANNTTYVNGKTEGNLNVNNAATATAVAWSGITSKPTTVSGYGITDALVRGGGIGNTDYNAQRTLASGIYSVDAAPTNGPPSGAYSNFIQMYERGDTSAQIVVDYATGQLYSRGIQTATPTYSAWRTYLSNTANLNISGGFTVTSYNLGTGSGTVTPSGLNGNYQYITNNGAFTIAAPATDCAIDLLVINGATAGTITWSGFQVGTSRGSSFTTTNGHDFLVSIRRINAISTYSVYAMQ